MIAERVKMGTFILEAKKDGIHVDTLNSVAKFDSYAERDSRNSLINRAKEGKRIIAL